MDPFGWTPAQYTAAATWIAAMAGVVTLAVLALTARYVAKQLEEASKLRRDQSRPYVIAAIDVEQQMLFMLRVENVGKSPAFDVRIQFEEPPRSEIREIENLRMLQEPIPTMPPGQKFRATWESSLTVFSEKEPYPHPLGYRVTVTYEDHEGIVYGPEVYILDFRVYEGQAIGLKGITELVKAVEQLVAEHKKWTDGTRGLGVSARNAVRDRRRQERPLHFRRARQTFQKEGTRAAVSYWVRLWRRRYGLWSR